MSVITEQERLRAVLVQARADFADVVETLREVECVSDCPPEWPRCGVCSARSRARWGLNRVHDALRKVAGL